MYWFKTPNRIITTSLCFALFTGCKPEVRQNGSSKYFDLKNYFTREAARLNKQHTLVVKTVNYNNQVEKQSVLIKSWERELALFTGSDINKPSWRNSYKTVINKDSTVYTAIDTNLNTRYVSIKNSGNKVTAIHISNYTKNLLYKTVESLSYYPDSLYRIEKKQSVKVLGTNNYLITGLFKTGKLIEVNKDAKR